MLSTLRLFLACSAAASALQVPSGGEGEPAKAKSFLLLGCSLDRNAVDYFCEGKPERRHDRLSGGCFDPLLNTRAGFIFHPGVGYNGDLEGPFFEHSPDSTKLILEGRASAQARTLLDGEPDVVVVDSSLWDLSVWHQEEGGIVPRDASDERVRQWCERDLPGLLAKVADSFPSSRVAFRTAPTCRDTHMKFTIPSVEKLYTCITNSTTDGGKLFGRYEVVDLHALVADLAEHMPQACHLPVGRHAPFGMLYQKDGYHLSEYPSLLYINEVLRRAGAAPSDPSKPPCYAFSSTRVAGAEEGEPEDPDYPFDL